MTLFSKRILPLLAFLTCMTFSTVVFAQDEKTDEKTDEAKSEETTQEEESPTIDKSFDGLLARYNEISGRMDDVKKQFDEAETPEDNTNFKEQYSRLVDEANLLIEELRATGTALLGEGKASDEVYETLTGMVINDAFFERDVQAMDLGQSLIENGIDVAFFEKAAEAERLGPAGKDIVRELELRCKEAVADDLPRVKLITSKGEVVIELFENDAPESVANFISLIKDGFYDGLVFHRVLDGFMAQGGDPEGNGQGGPGYKINCECYKPQYRRHFTGSLSMAHSGRNTGGSQFFLTFRRTDELDGKHTAFGRVIEGMDIVNSLQRIDPKYPNPSITPDKIEKAEVIRDRGHEYKPTKVGG